MTVKNLDLRPVSKGQAFQLARAYNLGAKTEAAPEGGFSAFVPGWTPAADKEDPGERAASFLTIAGACRGSASEAIEGLIASRPTTDAGRKYRSVKALATLLQKKVPVAPKNVTEVLVTPAPKKAPVKVAGGPGVSKNQLEELRLRIRELELKLALARVEELKAK